MYLQSKLVLLSSRIFLTVLLCTQTIITIMTALALAILLHVKGSANQGVQGRCANRLANDCRYYLDNFKI